MLRPPPTSPRAAPPFPCTTPFRSGAALTLLLVSGISSLSLAVAVRRQYRAWQAAGAATMLLWGALWSHAHLVLVPAMAGTVTAQTGTFLACFAIEIGRAHV